VAEVRPFAAVRYGEAAEGPLERLVAPPYDVIDDDARRELLARSRHNVVHLTLPDSEDEAARRWSTWLDEGVLRREAEAFWALQQDYVGPDGVARTRTGLVAALRLEPYERGVVLPHERTHREVREGRLRLLRAVRSQVEPIFLLYEGARPFDLPDRAPELEVEGARLWRLAEGAGISEAFADRQLLIADGHHRYETAVAFHEEDGTEASAWMLVVLVSAEDPGLTIFPTHRLFADERLLSPDGTGGDPERALAELAAVEAETAAVVQVTSGGASVVRGAEGELDVQLVDRLGHEGIAYTPDWEEAVRRVHSGDAEVAYLLRPTRIEDVWAVARRGETMPPKSTYFFPKLVSGLLFLPL
jgi:uncharacterized protein (DUF1015 family)